MMSELIDKQETLKKLCETCGYCEKFEKAVRTRHPDFVTDKCNFYKFLEAQRGREAEINEPPKSNADRIRQMTDEALAAFIDIYDIEDICKTRCAKTAEERNRCIYCGEECESQILKWLKQEVNKDAGSKTD